MKYFILTFLLFTKSFGQVIFKNNCDRKIYIAIASHEDKTGLTSKGWFAIEPYKEQNLYTPKLFGASTFYYCATIENCDIGYFGNTELYVDRQNAFSIPNASKNPNDQNLEIQKYKFIEVKINTLAENRINIDIPNLTCYNKRQGKWTFGLDKEDNFAELKQDIKSHREINFENDIPIGWCKDYFSDGKLKSEYKLLSLEPLKYDGKCTWYNIDGSLEKEILYHNGIPLSQISTTKNGELVTKEAEYDIVKLPIQNIYLNSTSNEFWKGGNSKSIIPVDLPLGTVEWYYEYTSSRSKELVEVYAQKFNLANQLSSVIDKSGLLSASINLFTSPPGGDICDTHLFENKFYNQFLTDQSFEHFTTGSRQNFKSGVVQIRNLNLTKLVRGLTPVVPFVPFGCSSRSYLPPFHSHVNYAKKGTLQTRSTFLA